MNCRAHWGNAFRMPLVTLLFSVLMSGMGCKGEPPKLTIENARASFSEAMLDEAEVYLTIVNAGGKDKLIGAKVSIPGTETEIHEMRGDLMVISKGLSIPPKSTVEFSFAGSHIMVMNLPKNVKVGYRFTLTLLFEKTGEVQLPLEFTKPRSAAPEPAMHEHHRM